jgi:hypothetical protein
LWLLAPLAVGATALALVVGGDRRGELPPLPPLPSPAPALLAAQAEAARGQSAALDALDVQMRAYRRALFEKLRQPEGR